MNYYQSVSRRNKSVGRWFLPLIVLFVVLLDQASKSLISYYLNNFQSIPVIPDIFHLTLIHNTGIAFGMFHGGSKLLLTVIIIGVSFLFYLAYKMRNETPIFKLGLGFVLGGAVGNLIDRLTCGSVIDFLDFRIWPVFNLADSFITIGVGILILTVLLGRKS